MTQQIGGDHYRNDEGEPHWDRVVRLGLPYCLARSTAHIERAMDKGEFRSDIEKAVSYLQHTLEQLDAGLVVPMNPNDPDYPVDEAHTATAVEEAPVASRRGRRGA